MSNAYEILSDPLRRSRYDATGFDGSSHQQSSSSQQYQYEQRSAEEAFRSVFEDADVIREAFQSLTEEIREEISFAYDAAKEGDWENVWNVVKANKGILIGIVVPAAVVLRFPWAVALTLRTFWGISGFVFTALVQHGKVHAAAAWLWQRMVAMSELQKARKAARKHHYDNIRRSYASSSSTSSTDRDAQGSSSSSTGGRKRGRFSKR